jgi:twitching motility protein PilI
VSEQTHQGGTGRELLLGIKALEARYLRNVVELPAQEAPPPVWSMVVFRMAGATFLAPLEQIAEVLTVPAEITQVPGTKSWVLGIANNRGTLLPIYDLDDCLNGVPRRRTGEDQVLVVRQEEFPFGILVGGPVGIHHCQAAMAVEVDMRASRRFGPLIDGGYLRGSEHLPVVNLERLSNLPQFASAAS